MSAGPLQPGQRREGEVFLQQRGKAWGSGVTLVARSGGAIAGLARLLDPNPGDGHHREHVRELVACGDDGVLGELARAAVALAGDALRVEASSPDGESAWITALRDAGLGLDARLPGGWLEDGVARDWLLFGRAGRIRRAEGPPMRAPEGGARAGITLHWADEATRAALRRFVAALVPGRAYPPGTLLSEAERLETARTSALLAPWLLALDERGEVAGALVLERPAAAQRAHVRRIHLDVARAVRGRGVATALVQRALREGRRHGALRLEADPRSGNAGAIAALRAGGMEPAGGQAGAWRLRGPSGSWDEDVLLFSAAAQCVSEPSEAPGVSGISGTSGASGIGSSSA